MMFKAIEDNQWGDARGLVERTELIRAKARRTVELLKREFETPSLLDDIGLVFTLPEQGTDVEVKSPIGEARMRLHFEIGGGGDAGVRGRYIVQRKTASMDDRVIWEPVWCIGLYPYGETILGDDTGSPVRIGSAFVDRTSMAVLSIGMSILYAMANGPQIVEI